MNAAKLLRDYLNIYGTYFLAIKRYKGYSELGHKQAKDVMHLYNTIKEL